jgi:hypothetical protein
MTGVGVLLLMSVVASATPCVSDTLTNYIALNATGGCTLGDKTIFDFGFTPDTLIDSDDITVNPSSTPFSATLQFLFGTAAGITVASPFTANVVIEYTATASTFPIDGVTLDLDSTPVGSGANVDATKQECLGGQFTLGGLPSTCSSGNIVGHNVNDPASPAASTIAFAPTFTVGFREVVQITGGDTGSSSTIFSVSNTIYEQEPQNPIPEPTTFSLLGAGLLGLGLIARRKRQA